MTFVNLKHLKETVAMVTKISDRNNPAVKISLSKDDKLTFQILFGMDGQVSLPVESRTIKSRSQVSDKTAVVPIEILSKIVRQLPILLEEVEIEFASPGLIITGEYDVYSMRYEFHNCQYLHKSEYDLTEEQVVSFSTDADSASVLIDAAKMAQKASNVRLDNLFLSCKGDEILISGSDGSRIMQKYVYTQEILDKDIDLIVSSELGLAIGRFAFTIARWDIYQNFVRVTLDEKVEIFAVRPLMPEFPDFQKWEDKSHHTSLVVNVSELKTRLNKLGKDVWLWLYTVENRLAIECYQSDSVGALWVKNTLKTPPALIIVNSKMLLDVVKMVKKGTAQLRLMLPKLVGESEADNFFDKGKDVRNVAYLEFDKNSYLVAGRSRQNLPTPPGVRDWLITQGWSILPESKPISTAAKSAVKILSDRWTGKGWERPELVACDCGTIHDESTLQPQSKTFQGYCEHCDDYRDLALYSVDYRCLNQTCNTLNEATEDRPILEPICMNCGKKEFATKHYFECLECNKTVKVNNCKTSCCDAILEEEFEVSWHCDVCESSFSHRRYFRKRSFWVRPGRKQRGTFSGCPHCGRSNELYLSRTCYCSSCGPVPYEWSSIPKVEAPTLPCPDCNQDLSDVPPQKVNDPFVVGSVTRF